MDGTYQLVRESSVLVSLVVLDNRDKGFPILFVFLDSETEKAIATALQIVKQQTGITQHLLVRV